jgi:flavodoxin
MKTMIIYCSEYKNHTEKIARFFTERTGSEPINIWFYIGIYELDLTGTILANSNAYAGFYAGI